MKPILIYDANIFSHMKIKDIKCYLDTCENLITDDVARELLKAKEKYAGNSDFQKRMDIVFNERNGLNDNLSLVLSHVPVGLGDTYDNTKSVIHIKSNPVICSCHHFWLPRIVSPAFIINSARHINSELTWRMKRGEIPYDNKTINYKKILQSIEIEHIESAYEETGLDAKRIIRTWEKRDEDIRKGKFKVSDSRIIMHALSIMLYTGRNVQVLTGDYDLIDLTVNLMASIVEAYVINEVLTEWCKDFSLKTNNHTMVDIPETLFYDKYEEVMDRIKHSEKCAQYTIFFFKKSDGKLYLRQYNIPVWLLSFALWYKGNMQCLVLDDKIYNKYPIQYTWHSEWRRESGTIRFEVWKRSNGEKIAIEPYRCMFSCKFELDEINNPSDLSAFI